MIVVFQIDNEEKRIDLMLSLSERTFSEYCDFKGGEAKYWDLRKKGEDFTEQAVTTLVSSIQKLCPGDVDSLPFALADDNYQELVDSGYQVQLGHELSVIRLYTHIVNLINEYKPERIPSVFKWNWLNKTYQVKSLPAARILADKALTTGEAIEVMEYKRRAKKVSDENVDQSGNIDFELGLTEVAILLRRNGEKLPSNRRHLTAFLGKRRKLFENMTLDKVMDLRFFLLNALVQLARTRITASSGTDLRIKPLERKANTRWTAKKLLGWRGMSPAGGSSIR